MFHPEPSLQTRQIVLVQSGFDSLDFSINDDLYRNITLQATANCPNYF